MSKPEDFSVFYTLIKLYCTKALSNQASSLAPDWLLLFQRPRILASFCRSVLSDFTFTSHFHALEREMATHSSVLAWKIPGMGEPGGLPSLGSHRVTQDWCDLAAAAATTFHHPPEGSQPEITFTEQIYDNTWNCALATYLGKRWQGLGRCIRCTANLEHWAYQAPGHLSGLDPVKVKTTQPVWICSLVEHRRPWAHRHGKCMQCRAHLGQFLCTAGWSLHSVDPWSTCYLGLRQTQCGTSTSQQYLFVLSLPPHSTAEQVRLNKCSPLNPHVREEIRHWRDLQIKEEKINKEGGTVPKVTGTTD